MFDRVPTIIPFDGLAAAMRLKSRRQPTAVKFSGLTWIDINIIIIIIIIFIYLDVFIDLRAAKRCLLEACARATQLE